MSSWPDLAFLAVALGASVFYGAKACAIFGVDAAGKHWPWKVHQFWLNFSGSFTGWLALWVVIPRVVTCVIEACAPELSVSDVALFFVAFVGVTGFLPTAIIGLVLSIKEVVAKLAGLLK